MRSVSLSSSSPARRRGSLAPVTAVGVPPPVADAGQLAPNSAGVFKVGPAFFETMQIPLMPGANSMSVRRQAAVRSWSSTGGSRGCWGWSTRLASRVTIGRDNNTFEVVGVAGEALFLYLKEDRATDGDSPYLQESFVGGSGLPYQMTYEVRAAGNPLGLASACARSSARSIPALRCRI